MNINKALGMSERPLRVVNEVAELREQLAKAECDLKVSNAKLTVTTNERDGLMRQIVSIGKKLEEAREEVSNLNEICDDIRDTFGYSRDDMVDLTTYVAQDYAELKQQLADVTRERDEARKRAGSNQSYGVDFGSACGRNYLSVCGFVIAVEGDTQRDVQLTRQFGAAWNKDAIDCVVAAVKEKDGDRDTLREQLATVQRVLVESLNITEVGNEFAPTCVDVDNAMSLAAAAEVAIDTLKLSAEKHKLDAEEANKALATVQAEAAAMRRFVDEVYELTTDFPRPNDDRGYVLSNRITADCRKFMQGTAGRGLLDELERKDERIRELEHRIDELDAECASFADQAYDATEPEEMSKEEIDAIVSKVVGEQSPVWRYRKAGFALYRTKDEIAIQYCHLGSWEKATMYRNWQELCDDSDSYPCDKNGKRI